MNMKLHKPINAGMHSLTKNYTTYTTKSLVDHIISDDPNRVSFHMTPPAEAMLDHHAIISSIVLKH